MSLVGTRPILPDELEQYELHHRARIAIKPGITGMWQVSGRSDITDLVYFFRTFEKVPLSLAACKSNNRSGSRGTTGGQVLETRDKSSENTPGSDPIKNRKF